MATNILSIGQSALTAAQVGINTTGHNIANASTPGYSRQVVVQGAALAQNFGFGYLGQGTEITAVQRVYNEHLVSQAQSAQSTLSGIDSYYAQVKQINDLLADPTAGLSASIQGFFDSVQELTTAPSSVSARQSVLSTAESLVSTLQGLDSRLQEIGQDVNRQIVASVEAINAYAEEIAVLNDAIAKAQSATGNAPNDLLDQRDLLVSELSKEINVTVVEQGNGDYNIFIGNGQPLVVGSVTSSLVAVGSATDPEKIEVGYLAADGSTVVVGESSFSGGTLGGLIEFRADSLVSTQNALGRIAIGLATTFNEQHVAGYDLNGVAGGAFFSVGTPVVGASSLNTGSASVGAAIVDVGALTTSDYQLSYDGSSYTLTRLSDGTTTSFASLPQTVDGVEISLSGTPAAGDNFLIQPTANGASAFAVLLADPAEIAAASAPGASGDNTNALALAALQTEKLLGNGTSSYLDAFGQLVSEVGNKTRELEISRATAASILEQATIAVQSESGVNLDEEATNLLRYQQAYQAAAKMMQIAKEMFDLLVSLGR